MNKMTTEEINSLIDALKEENYLDLNQLKIVKEDLVRLTNTSSPSQRNLYQSRVDLLNAKIAEMQKQQAMDVVK